jgi:uncharacterized protein (DUF2236 family)
MINPGLFSPATIVWKIHSDPSMAVGGIRALLEQALHPAAMAGVAAHSNFRDDAWGRLQRTGDYVSTITFGEVAEAEKLAARVRAIHTKLGLDDPHHLLWVHMAMVDSFLDTALRSGLELSDIEKDLYISQMRIFADLVGIPSADVPISLQELRDYFNEIKPELSASDDAKRAALFLTIPPMPKMVRFATPAAPAWASLATLAASSLPNWARSLYGWPNLPGAQIATSIALKATRASLSLIPSAIIEPPVFKKARIRWNLEESA